MPLGYDIYADIGLLYIRGQGVTTQRQRMSAMLAWLSEPQYEDCRRAHRLHGRDGDAKGRRIA